MLPLSRVAYVDDDSDIRRIAELALHDIGGFDVRCWGSGADFLREWGAWSPQIVLLDLRMPDMDGERTLAALRAQQGGADLPVVMLTGSVDPPRISGLAGVLAKPFDAMSLAARLRGIWAELPGNGG